MNVKPCSPKFSTLKLLYLIPIFLLLSLSSCQKEDLLGELTGTWQLDKYKWLITGAVGKENKDLPRSIILEFEDDGITGTYIGQTPANNDCTANYTLEDTDITFKDIKGNTNEEPEWGKKFWRSINTVESWRIKNGKLWLFHTGEREAMIFKRVN